MEIIKKYPLFLRAINGARLITGENRVRKNLNKICKNYEVYKEDLNEALIELLNKSSEKEISMVVLIEILDDVNEHIKFKPNKVENLQEYISIILSTYNTIKRV